MGPSIVTVFVTSEGASSERRFDKSMPISSLKDRLEPITGVPASTMRITLYSHSDVPVGCLSEDERMLGYYPVADYMRLDVVDTNPYKRPLLDAVAVDKYEMGDDEYSKRHGAWGGASALQVLTLRIDSVRAFMQRNKMGKYADRGKGRDDDSVFHEEAARIAVGSRCEVDGDKRGVVKYVGRVAEIGKPGFFVGVEFDEPVGKHGGTVKGSKYFEARDKHASFVRPDRVRVGEYPEIDLMDELEEM
ncbi:hypothetical protein SeMB42_g00532 [Synchytrium endobioticum]|uniref:CAP-Gly domain-containing protein n=1 Tax=Synchytrium endobioticum TaxID=286115 RepID=A0A507DLT8_9FUNG|nr:hypothetical protein SeLEV6574_g00043 [Synchytrium endobioticum]TPX53986.1 hypothetical protein SeMB42_g00532 [Synchytrium endobioticum]